MEAEGERFRQAETALIRREGVLSLEGVFLTLLSAFARFTSGDMEPARGWLHQAMDKLNL